MKKFFKKYMPDVHVVQNNPMVAKLGPRITDPNLWHFNRRSVSAGMFAGVFSAFLPPGLQLLLAIPFAVIIRGNLAVAFGATWITNPFTYLPVYFACYRLGLFLMGRNADIDTSQFHLNTLANDLWNVGQPLLLGCLVCSVVFGGLSFGLVRLLWRLHVVNHLRARARRKHNQTRNNAS